MTSATRWAGMLRLAKMPAHWASRAGEGGPMVLSSQSRLMLRSSAHCSMAAVVGFSTSSSLCPGLVGVGAVFVVVWSVDEAEEDLLLVERESITTEIPRSGFLEVRSRCKPYGWFCS